MTKPKIVPYADVAVFHGHSCPGLALGYRVAVAALENLAAKRTRDEELVCVVENSACGVDAVQAVTGCTFGKGNLIFKDYGKHVFTFFHRPSRKALRFSAKMARPPEPGNVDMVSISNRVLSGTASEDEKRLWKRSRTARIRLILQSPDESVFDMRPVEYAELESAHIFESVVCDRCGERVMATRTVSKNGKALCIPCSQAVG